MKPEPAQTRDERRVARAPAHDALSFELTLTDAQLDVIAGRVAELLAVPAATPWKDVAEAAEWLRCSKDRIYDLSAQRKLSPPRDGRRVLLHVDDLDAYLESNR